MGQLLQKDNPPQLPGQIQQLNVSPVVNKRNLTVCPFVEFYTCERIFYIENQDEIQALYKFGQQYIIHLHLKKQDQKKQPGIYIKIADEYVYAYKHRKLDRSDKIKPEKLLFKKRIYNYVQKKDENQDIQISDALLNNKLQQLLIKFAQIKLLSLLQIGPKIGRVYNGSDGIITNSYIEFFSQITIHSIYEDCLAKNSQLKKFQKKLVNLNIFNQNLLKNQHLSYSMWRKGYVLKQLHYYDKQIQVQKQVSYQNKSIYYIENMFKTQITKTIMDLDNQAKMLPYINNLIFQHDFQKALSKMQESLSMIQNKDQKIQFAEQISSMISKQSSASSKQYQKRIQKIVSLSSSRQLDSMNSPNLSRNNSISSPNSKENLTQNLLKQNKRQSKLENDKQIRQSLQENDPNLKSKDRQKSKDKKVVSISQNQKKQKFNYFCKCLKIHSLDKNKQMINNTLEQMSKLQYKTNLQLKIILGKISMDNARSRHALAIFQRLLYFSNEASSLEIFHFHQIALLAGIIYYHRYSYKKSLKAFEKALNILIRLKHYSIKMMTVFNNIACVYHVLKNYDQCLLYLHRGFRLGQYSVDYEFLMRSNMAMTLAQNGRIKQAKAQMMKTNNIIQPLNNMVIYCKFYSNLAYLELLQLTDIKNLDKVISSFQQACNIQGKYLIPHGYKPSIFLHNNMGMVYYKRKDYKKAKAHAQKIINQLNDIEGMVAIKVHFNIGKIFSQGFNYDIPLKHFQQARVLLNKLDQKSNPIIRKYKQVINKQIEDIQKMKIDELSEQQSYTKLSYMSSSLLKKV